MILSEVRTTIRNELIKLGYQEWKGYLSDAVPGSILEKSFHVSVTGGTGRPVQHILKVTNDVELNLWRKGFKNAVEAQDAGLMVVQDVICALLNVETRTLPAYRRIDLDSYTLEPIANDNSSICKVTIKLTVEVIIEVTQTVQEKP